MSSQHWPEMQCNMVPRLTMKLKIEKTQNLIWKALISTKSTPSSHFYLTYMIKNSYLKKKIDFVWEPIYFLKMNVLWAPRCLFYSLRTLGCKPQLILLTWLTPAIRQVRHWKHAPPNWMSATAIITSSIGSPSPRVSQLKNVF